MDAPDAKVCVATNKTVAADAGRRLTFSLCCPVLPQVALADFLACGSCDSHLRNLLEEDLS